MQSNKNRGKIKGKSQLAYQVLRLLRYRKQKCNSQPFFCSLIIKNEKTSQVARISRNKISKTIKIGIITSGHIKKSWNILVVQQENWLNLNILAPVQPAELLQIRKIQQTWLTVSCDHYSISKFTFHFHSHRKKISLH